MKTLLLSTGTRFDDPGFVDLQTDHPDTGLHVLHEQFPVEVDVLLPAGQLDPVLRHSHQRV